MPLQPHRLRRLSLDVATLDLDAALGLRARAEELARTLLPPVLELVFDALVPSDLHVRLERLDVDLGTIAPDRLEAEVPPALEAALTRALSAAIAAARAAPGPEGSAVSTSEAMLDHFATYLSTGTAPFAAADDPAAALGALIAADPAALAARLRDLGHDRRALERLVLHGGEANLAALLEILAPGDAAVIRRYMADLILLRLSAAEPDHAVPPRAWWVLTLEYLLRDAGTQFNRRSFVVYLLEGVARTEGIVYDALLTLLREALALTRRNRPLGGSLPAVLETLFAGLPPQTAPNTPPRAAPQAPPPATTDTPPATTPPAAMTRGAMGADDAFARARAGDLAPLLALLRAALGDMAMMEALAARLDEALFAALVRHLEPANAMLILEYAGELIAVHRDRSLVSLTQSGFERLIRSLVLRYALQEPDSTFNSRSWLRRMLRGIAAARGIAYADLLAPLAEGLARLRHRLPAAASLPAVVDALVAEQAAEADALEPLIARLRAAADDKAALGRLVAGLTKPLFDRIVTRLDPVNAALILDYVEDLAVAHRHDSGVTQPISGFEQTVRRLTLRYLGREPGSSFNRRTWLRRVLADVAAEEDVPFAALLGSLSDALAQGRTVLPTTSSLQAVVGELLRDLAGAAEPSPNDAMAQAEVFLRSGRAPGGGEALRDKTLRQVLRQAANDKVGFAALLRRLARAMPGAVERIADRLLDFLLPDEVAACLAPEVQLALPVEAAPWRHAFAALLAGTPVVEAGAVGTVLDRLAALRHWLDHGVMPWWAPADLAPEALAQLTMLQARLVFDDGGAAEGGPEERAVVRLRRMVDRLGEAAGLQRLAPSEFAAGGKLAAMLRDAPVTAREDIRLRAVAAAVMGSPPDPAWLALSVPPPAPAEAAETAPSMQPDDRVRLLSWFAEPEGAPPVRLIRLLAELADAGDKMLDAALLAGLTRNSVRDRWAMALPDEALGRVLQRLVPAHAAALLAAMTVLAAAWRQLTPPGPAGLPWALLLGLLPDVQAANARTLITRLAGAMAAGDPDALPQLRERALAIARQAGAVGLVAALQPDAAPTATPGERPGRAPDDASRETPTQIARQASREASGRRPTSPPIESDAPMYIGNAGLVLFNPYLPLFFERLGLLSAVDGVPRIAGLEAASRAVHLLQYLVDQRCDRPEPALVLNKLLCGLAPADPILPAIAPSEPELAVCTAVTRALIDSWTSIRNAAPDGVRETFLQRDGRLSRGVDRWELQVQRRTVDVLTDLIPWNRSVVYHRWMERAVYVTW